MAIKAAYRKRLTMCGLAEKKVATILDKSKGKQSEYQKILLENMKQKETALLLKRIGAKKPVIDRATLMKWETKKMLGNMENEINSMGFRPAKWEMREQAKEVQTQFEEIVRPKLIRDIRELSLSPKLRKAKEILRNNNKKNSK